MLPIETIITQINAQHHNAMKQADAAVENVKAAGKLLLRVKAPQPHSMLTKCVQGHLKVSEEKRNATWPKIAQRLSHLTAPNQLRSVICKAEALRTNAELRKKTMDTALDNSLLPIARTRLQIFKAKRQRGTNLNRLRGL